MRALLALAEMTAITRITAAFLATGCGGSNEDEAPVLEKEDAADGCVLVGDRTVCNHGHSVGFRSENLRERRLYLEARGFENIEDSLLMASDRDGSLGTAMPDPITPILRARLGETVRLRVVSYGPELHTFHVHGHVWIDPAGTPTDNIDLLPAEAFEATFTAGGGAEPASPERGGPGDWMYHCHVEGHVTSGMWSLLRVIEEGDADEKLEMAGRFPHAVPEPIGGDGETVDVWVVAIDASLTLTREYSQAVDDFRAVRRAAWIYVPVTENEFVAGDADAMRALVDPDAFDPWVLSVLLGSRVRVHLKNLLSDDDGAEIPVSLHPHGVAYGIDDDGGTPGSVAVGRGDVVDYEYVADYPGVWPYHDHALPNRSLARGLFAAIVVMTPEELVTLDRDYVVTFNDMDFEWLNGIGETAKKHVEH